MNPSLPRSYTLSRRGLVAAMSLVLTALVVAIAWHYATGGWASTQQDFVHTLQHWQYRIFHAVRFPWE